VTRDLRWGGEVMVALSQSRVTGGRARGQRGVKEGGGQRVEVGDIMQEEEYDTWQHTHVSTQLIGR
jgi:hypothetical protein